MKGEVGKGGGKGGCVCVCVCATHQWQPLLPDSFEAGAAISASPVASRFGQGVGFWQRSLQGPAEVDLFMTGH